MKKKIFFMLTMVAMLICIFAICVSAETMTRYIEFDVLLEGEPDYQTVYTPEGKDDLWTVYVSFANEFYTDIDQSATIDKTKIVKIDMSNAKATGFSNNNIKQLIAASDNTVFANVTEIKFPNNPGNFNMIAGSFCKDWSSLTTIDFGSAYQTGDSSFENCTAITELTIPEQITKINNYSFKGCTGLEKLTILGNNTNGNNIFVNCTALEEVVLGENITTIKSGMFNGCSSLKEITIPEGITEIGSNAFMGTQLTSLHIPSTVTYIGVQVLENVKTFTTLTFAPNSQLKVIDHRSFQYTSLSGDLVLPYGLEDIDYSAFASTLITSVKIPSTVVDTNEYYSVFANCTLLEYAEISAANLGREFFSGCTALKAISIPEGMTSMERRAFRNCTSLKAVYLPSTLETIGSNTAFDQGTFCDCKSLYFVNEPFEVRDENGVILGSNFVMPTEPQVYFMPSSLTTVYGCEFKGCQQINRYVVFPTGLTQITAWEGAFSDTGINNTKGGATYVFLGDMDTLCYSARDNRYKNVSYVFANKNDTDITSLSKFQLGYKAAAVNSYAYFCAGNVVYDLSSFVAGSETYVVGADDFEKTVYTDETQPHFINPKLTTFVDPTCVTNSIEKTYCFCGTFIGSSELENTALGHSHTIPLGLIYESFDKEGNYSYKCERCGDVNKDEVAPALFVCLGYSASENGNAGFILGFKVNHEAIENYKTETGNALEYGMFAVLKKNIGENGILNADGSENAGVIKADLTRNQFAVVSIKVKGFTNDEQKSAQIALGLYVIVDGESKEISYYQSGTPEEGEKFTSTSYNEQAPVAE